VGEAGGAAALGALLCGGYVPAAGERVGVLSSEANECLRRQHDANQQRDLDDAGPRRHGNG